MCITHHRIELPFGSEQEGLPLDAEGKWLGSESATEKKIRACEKRLGTELPPSYRDFLKTSNGWRFMAPSIERLHGCDDLEWFRDRNQAWIDAWTTGDPEPGDDF